MNLRLLTHRRCPTIGLERRRPGPRIRCARASLFLFVALHCRARRRLERLSLNPHLLVSPPRTASAAPGRLGGRLGCMPPSASLDRLAWCCNAPCASRRSPLIFEQLGSPRRTAIAPCLRRGAVAYRRLTGLCGESLPETGLASGIIGAQSHEDSSEICPKHVVLRSCVGRHPAQHNMIRLAAPWSRRGARSCANMRLQNLRF